MQGNHVAIVFRITSTSLFRVAISLLRMPHVTFQITLIRGTTNSIDFFKLYVPNHPNGCVTTASQAQTRQLLWHNTEAPLGHSRRAEGDRLAASVNVQRPAHPSACSKKLRAVGQGLVVS